MEVFMPIAWVSIVRIIELTQAHKWGNLKEQPNSTIQ